MKTKLNFIFLLFVIFFNITCTADEEKELETFLGIWAGAISARGNASNTQNLTLNVTSEGNPIKGTYTLGSGASAVLGDISGSALGLIYTLTLKPKTTGVTYTINGNWDDGDDFTGTMKGTENGNVVTYDFVLKRK